MTVSTSSHQRSLLNPNGLKPFDVFQLPTVKVHKFVRRQRTQESYCSWQNMIDLVLFFVFFLYYAMNQFINNQIFVQTISSTKEFFKNVNQEVLSTHLHFLKRFLPWGFSVYLARDQGFLDYYLFPKC